MRKTDRQREGDVEEKGEGEKGWGREREKSRQCSYTLYIVNFKHNIINFKPKALKN